jgi:hypothetical protein
MELLKMVKICEFDDITAEEFEQIPHRGPDYNTPLHDLDNPFEYTEAHRESEASMGLGNPWQTIEINHKYSTRTMDTLNKWAHIEGMLHNKQLLLTGRVSPKANNKGYMVIEDMDSQYISDLDNGEFNNAYYKIFPHKHNPYKVEYVGSNQFPDIGADKVVRKHTDNMTAYMGSPSYTYGVDRLLSLNVKGFRPGQKGIVDMELRIRAPKGNPLAIYKDIEVVKLTMDNGNSLLLMPIIKYNGHWIYNSYNDNDKFQKRIGKNKINTYRKWAKTPAINEKGLFRYATEVFKQKEVIQKVEYIKIRINSGRYHIVTEDMKETLNRKISDLGQRLWDNENGVEHTIPLETRKKMRFVLETMYDIQDEITV